MAGADEIFELAQDFGDCSSQIVRGLYSAWKDSGEAFAEDWASNARETSGEHGKHYPDAITSETRVSTGLHIETGPESARKQGGMGPGFEFGSVNQPPHLDGARALPTAERRLLSASDTAIGYLLP